jgi:hypothetical protein
MKRILLLVAVVLLLGACLPFPNLSNPTPAVDVAATNQANLQTSVVQTLTAQPTFTAMPPTVTVEELSATPAPLLSDTPAASSTAGVADTPVVTSTFDVATSTNISGTTVPSGSASVTPTLGILTYGTLPPYIVPYSDITLVNRSKRQAYISLQVFTEKGGPTIIEYPVKGQVTVKAPTGHYLYVAWVGGREMVGEFRLKKDQDLTIILYKDRVEIK